MSRRPRARHQAIHHTSARSTSRRRANVISRIVGSSARSQSRMRQFVGLERCHASLTSSSQTVFPTYRILSCASTSAYTLAAGPGALVVVLPSVGSACQLTKSSIGYTCPDYPRAQGDRSRASACPSSGRAAVYSLPARALLLAGDRDDTRKRPAASSRPSCRLHSPRALACWRGSADRPGAGAPRPRLRRPGWNGAPPRAAAQMTAGERHPTGSASAPRGSRSRAQHGAEPTAGARPVPGTVSADPEPDQLTNVTVRDRGVTCQGSGSTPRYDNAPAAVRPGGVGV